MLSEKVFPECFQKKCPKSGILYHSCKILHSYPNVNMKNFGIQGQPYKCLPSQKTNKVKQNYWCKESFLFRKMWKNNTFSLVKYHIPFHPQVEIIVFVIVSKLNIPKLTRNAGNKISQIPIKRKIRKHTPYVPVNPSFTTWNWSSMASLLHGQVRLLYIKTD